MKATRKQVDKIAAALIAAYRRPEEAPFSPGWRQQLMESIRSGGRPCLMPSEPMFERPRPRRLLHMAAGALAVIVAGLILANLDWYDPYISLSPAITIVEQRAVTRALDIGTGSGVLAIALAKLGVAEVWAIDIDARACAIAQANARCNGVATQVNIRSGVDEVTGDFHLITANLFANLLEEMAVRVSRRLGPAGVMICSGFLTADESRVRSAYEAQGLQVVRRHEEQSWVTLAVQQAVQP
jgi:protein-L-isoaspartate O-methyltransferase